VTIIQQIVSLLSESPGNLVYHLLILFSAQVVVALAWWQHSRDRNDTQAERLLWAGAGILVTRIILAGTVAVIDSSSNPDAAVSFLPPLEQALTTAVTIIVTWSLLPLWPRRERLVDAIALALIIMTGVVYAFFAPTWLNEFNSSLGQIYMFSPQATIWGIFQLVVIGAGILALLRTRTTDSWMRLLMLGLLLGAHAAEVANLQLAASSNFNIPYWIRLAHFAVIPLLAIFTYRHNVSQLLAAQVANRPAEEQVARALAQSRELLRHLDTYRVQQEGVALIHGFIDAHYAAIAYLLPGDTNQLRLVGSHDQQEITKRWQLSLENWPAFRLAMEQNQTIELSPLGVGSRQVHDLYKELAVKRAGPMLVEPLLAGDVPLGVMLLAEDERARSWDKKVKALAPALAAFISQALVNARQHQAALGRTMPALATVDSTQPGHFTDLEHARDLAQANLGTMTQELAQSRRRLKDLEIRLAQSAASEEDANRKVAEAVEARELTTTALRRVQKQLDAADQRILALEAQEALQEETNRQRIEENQQLREKLTQARQQLRQVGSEAAPAGMQIESAELDEMEATANQLAQSGTRQPQQDDDDQIRRIISLETEVADLREALIAAEEAMAMASAGEGGLSSDWVMTTITRYSSELEAAHLHIQRLEGALEHPGSPHEQIALEQSEPLNDPGEVINTAVDAVMMLVRKKGLRLSLDINPNLPPIPLHRDSFYQIVHQLLYNTVMASHDRSQVSIRTQTDLPMEGNTHNAASSKKGVFRLIFTNSEANSRPDASPHDVAPRLVPSGLVAAGLEDRSVGLRATDALVRAIGGRILVDSDEGEGSIITVILPISLNGKPQPEQENGAN
jgi:hypothetical protein